MWYEGWIYSKYFAITAYPSYTLPRGDSQVQNILSTVYHHTDVCIYYPTRHEVYLLNTIDKMKVSAISLLKTHCTVANINKQSQEYSGDQKSEISPNANINSQKKYTRTKSIWGFTVRILFSSEKGFFHNKQSSIPSHTVYSKLFCVCSIVSDNVQYLWHLVV